MTKPACFVIAIKGTSGSGKSTLAAALAKELEHRSSNHIWANSIKNRGTSLPWQAA